MSSELLTVESAAGELQVHPKTVLRFIREGRLKAAKVGRQYRISRDALSAFARSGEPADPQRVRTTTIVDLEDVDAVTADRLQTTVLAAVGGRQGRSPSLSVNVAYDQTNRAMKVVAFGSPSDCAAVLSLVAACMEQA